MKPREEHMALGHLIGSDGWKALSGELEKHRASAVSKVVKVGIQAEARAEYAAEVRVIDFMLGFPRRRQGELEPLIGENQ